MSLYRGWLVVRKDYFSLQKFAYKRWVKSLLCKGEKLNLIHITHGEPEASVCVLYSLGSYSEMQGKTGQSLKARGRASLAKAVARKRKGTD